MNTPTLPFDTILFDLDGTLVDTELAAAHAVAEWFAQRGVTLVEDDAARVTGRTWSSAIGFLLEKYPLGIDTEEVVRQVMKVYRSRLEKNLPVVPGSPEAVRSLSGHFPLALVSGSRREEIEWALKKIGIFTCFKVILGAEDYPHSKPAPDGFLKALELLHCPAGRGLVFEDSAAGIASARAAGLWVVAVTCTNHFRQDPALAHHRIPDLREVNPEWIARLGLQLGGAAAASR